MAKTYETYKDSGVAWIGEIPNNWKICRIKDEYIFQTGATPPTGKEEFFEGDNVWISIADMKERIVYDSKKKLSDLGVQKCSMSIVPQGCLLYSFKLSVGQVAFAGCDLYTNEAIASFLTERGYLPFLYYTAPLFIVYNANTNIYGASILNQELIKNAFIPLPPLHEQQAIASFLDKKCEEIDSLIALQDEMISELQAYKQSVIAETVTKGLDSNAKMKDSGVEWIGEIPEGWDVKPFKYIFKTGKGLSFTKADLVNEGVPVISYGQVHSKQNKGTQIVDSLIRFVPVEMTLNSPLAKVHIGDFIFADTSEDLEGCGNCVYIDKEIGLYAGYHSVIAHAQSKSSNLYLAYLFLTNCWRSQIRSRVSGIKVLSISQSIINQTTVILPHLSEQRAITSYLDEKTAQIDALISLKQEKIAELKNYKKSIIYEYVTGKKRV